MIKKMILLVKEKNVGKKYDKNIIVEVEEKYFGKKENSRGRGKCRGKKNSGDRGKKCRKKDNRGRNEFRNIFIKKSRGKKKK